MWQELHSRSNPIFHHVCSLRFRCLDSSGARLQGLKIHWRQEIWIFIKHFYYDCASRYEKLLNKWLHWNWDCSSYEPGLVSKLISFTSVWSFTAVTLLSSFLCLLVCGVKSRSSFWAFQHGEKPRDLSWVNILLETYIFLDHPAQVLALWFKTTSSSSNGSCLSSPRLAACFFPTRAQFNLVRTRSKISDQNGPINSPNSAFAFTCLLISILLLFFIYRLRGCCRGGPFPLVWGPFGEWWI